MKIDIGDDVRLYFDVAGTALDIDGASVREKPTLLVLHGGPGFDHTSMRPWFDRFADLAQVVWYDHRGQGRSDGWDDRDRWTIDTWADDVVRLCDALGIERPIVFGQSFGGLVTMHYAARHPDHPAKVVLSNASARSNVDRIVAAFRRLHGDDVAEVAHGYWTDPDTWRDRYLEVASPVATCDPRRRGRRRSATRRSRPTSCSRSGRPSTSALSSPTSAAPPWSSPANRTRSSRSRT